MNSVRCIFFFCVPLTFVVVHKTILMQKNIISWHRHTNTPSHIKRMKSVASHRNKLGITKFTYELRQNLANLIYIAIYWAHFYFTVLSWAKLWNIVNLFDDSSRVWLFFWNSQRISHTCHSHSQCTFHFTPFGYTSCSLCVCVCVYHASVSVCTDFVIRIFVLHNDKRRISHPLTSFAEKKYTLSLDESWIHWQMFGKSILSSHIVNTELNVSKC